MATNTLHLSTDKMHVSMSVVKLMPFVLYDFSSLSLFFRILFPSLVCLCRLAKKIIVIVYNLVFFSSCRIVSFTELCVFFFHSTAQIAQNCLLLVYNFFVFCFVTRTELTDKSTTTQTQKKRIKNMTLNKNKVYLCSRTDISITIRLILLGITRELQKKHIPISISQCST